MTCLSDMGIPCVVLLLVCTANKSMVHVPLKPVKLIFHYFETINVAIYTYNTPHPY